MNGVDVVIVAWLVVSIFRGYHIGLLRQAASFVGFILGLLCGAWVAPVFIGDIQDTSAKLAIVLILTFGLGFLGAGLFEMIALKVQRRVRFNLAQVVNSILGAVFGVGATLILVWLLLSALNRLPLAGFGLSISESRVYQGLVQTMPPAPTILDQLGRIATPYGFPQIFVGGEPQAAPKVAPVSSDVEAAAAKAHDAVVRIEGYACGDITTGSGFIAAPGFVVSNAHVVAGVGMPVVVRGDEKYRAVPVWFDTKLDFAVLRVNGLGAPVLPLAPTLAERGQSGAVLGYPGGGPLTVSPGVVRNRYEAIGRDIYGQSLMTREIYEVQASIHPGNSGGPLVLPDGSVAGIMFGASTSHPETSYAITSTEAIDELRQAMSKNTLVSTGNCL